MSEINLILRLCPPPIRYIRMCESAAAIHQ